MCSNPSTRKELQIRPDFDMDVYLHPPSMHQHYFHRRSRKISTSSIDSTDGNNGSLFRRFSFSSLFGYFSRQNSTPEFPTLTNVNDTNSSPKIQNDTVKDGPNMEKEIPEFIQKRFLQDEEEF